MNLPKSDEYDYINFLIATPKVFSCTEAERVQPDAENSPSHDAVTRFLRRSGNDSSFLRNESSGFADLKRGISVSDDSAPDKPYAEKTEPVCHHRPEIDELRRLQLADFSRTIGEYHRGLRQYCGAERSFVRIAKSQRNHIGLSIRAFLRLEIFSLKTGYSRFEAKCGLSETLSEHI